MGKILYFLLFDVVFIWALVGSWGEIGGYAILILAAVAFFTWELFRSIKSWLGK